MNVPISTGATGIGSLLSKLGIGAATGGPAGAIIGGVSGLLSSLFGNSEKNSEAEAADKLARDKMAQDQAQFAADQAQRLGISQADNALKSTQLDPYTQLKATQKQALLSSLLGNPGQTHLTKASLAPVQPFLSSDARQGAYDAFQKTAGAAGGSYYTPQSSSSAGYGSAAPVAPPPAPNTNFGVAPDPDGKQALMDQILKRRKSQSTDDGGELY